MTSKLRSAGRLALSCLAAAAVLSTGPVQAQQPTVMKLSTPTLNDGQHEFLKRLAAAIEKASQGRIKAEVYPASQLGPIPRQIEATQLGAVQGFAAPPEFFDGVDTRFQVLTAPGLFDDFDHADRVQKDAEFRKAFLPLGLNRGLKVGALFLVGPGGFNTRTPVAKLADLKGMKLRVLASAMQMEPIKKLGASGIPMTLGEVLPGLQQGTIDGTLGAIPVFASLRFYDAAKFFTETNFVISSSMLVLSKAWLDKLPADLQKIVVEESLRVGDEMHPYIKEFFEAQKKVWVEKGGTILQIPAEERAKAMAEQAAIAREVVEKDRPLKEIFDIVVAAAARTKR